jgi:hypothetical protein
MQHIDVHHRCANIHQRGGSVFDAVVGLICVLKRENIDVNKHRIPPRLHDYRCVVGNPVFLYRHEQHIHSVTGTGFEHNVVEIDVINIERNVLLGLPLNRLGKFGVRHRRELDLLDDHRVAR